MSNDPTQAHEPQQQQDCAPSPDGQHEWVYATLEANGAIVDSRHFCKWCDADARNTFMEQFWAMLDEQEASPDEPG